MNVIFSDISGETFARARDYAEECRRLEMLRRADRFVLLLDGGLLARPDRREEVYRGGALLLRRCVEEGMLDKYSYVDVLFTKYDLVYERGLVGDTNVFVERVEQRFKEHFGAKLGRLCFYKVAARSSNPMLADSNRLAEVFSTWVEVSPIYERRYYTPAKHEPPPAREFDRYHLRHPSGE